MKILHVFACPSKVYIEGFIEMIENNLDKFGEEEHVYCTNNTYIYEFIKMYENVVYMEDLLDGNLSRFHAMTEAYDYVFLHEMRFTSRQILRLDKRTAQKIVWIVWGHDLYGRKPPLLEEDKSVGTIKTLQMGAFRLLRRVNTKAVVSPKIARFKAIGVGIKADEIEARRVFGGNITTVWTPYSLGYDFHLIDLAISEHKKNEPSKNRPLKIMVGHSAFQTDGHEEMLNELLKYRDQNILVSMIISYGDQDYIKVIKEKALEMYGDKVEFIEELMDPYTYCQYLMSVDICMLNFTREAAYANICVLLYMGKKIFFHHEGVMYQEMMREQIKAYPIRDIRKMSFEEFSTPTFDEDEYKSYVVGIKGEESVQNYWKNVFDWLGEKNG